MRRHCCTRYGKLPKTIDRMYGADSDSVRRHTARAAAMRRCIGMPWRGAPHRSWPRTEARRGRRRSCARRAACVGVGTLRRRMRRIVGRRCARRHKCTRSARVWRAPPSRGCCAIGRRGGTSLAPRGEAMAAVASLRSLSTASRPRARPARRCATGPFRCRRPGRGRRRPHRRGQPRRAPAARLRAGLADRAVARHPAGPPARRDRRARPAARPGGRGLRSAPDRRLALRGAAAGAADDGRRAASW